MSSMAVCLMLLTGSLLHLRSAAVSCYQCVNNPDPYCNQRTCHHGLFGCIKTVTYAGGLDPSGVQSENPQHKVLNFKGCNMLPFGGLEGCRETSLFGDIRQVTCYCNYDFCNSASRTTSTTAGIFLLFVLLWFWLQ
ncbi:hypothetical protein M514_06072 [Trichuris suis]|uniref:Protein sleepless n=1 Tax=Trichuris suis TaxID=68888 RepID=A0A085NKB9_9BILA|nr:hypothetical protein M513_06072 [Trichuris suis]KFD69915.1 hypothetical protein M514_06072 [Trichuris suis]